MFDLVRCLNRLGAHYAMPARVVCTITRDAIPGTNSFIERRRYEAHLWGSREADLERRFNRGSTSGQWQDVPAKLCQTTVDRFVAQRRRARRNSKAMLGAINNA